MMHSLKILSPNSFQVVAYDIKLNDLQKIEREEKEVVTGNLNTAALFLMRSAEASWSDIKLAVKMLEESNDSSFEASFGVFGGLVTVDKKAA